MQICEQNHGPANRSGVTVYTNMHPERVGEYNGSDVYNSPLILQDLASRLLGMRAVESVSDIPTAGNNVSLCSQLLINCRKVKLGSQPYLNLGSPE